MKTIQGSTFLFTKKNVNRNSLVMFAFVGTCLCVEQDVKFRDLFLICHRSFLERNIERIGDRIFQQNIVTCIIVLNQLLVNLPSTQFKAVIFLCF